MASDAPSRRNWFRTPISFLLIPASSEFDRLLVEEPLDELGGGPMDPSADERLLVLDDAKRIAAEGLAERIAARATSTRGIVFGSVAFLGLMCVAAFRNVESHDASLVARISEGLFQESSTDRAKKPGGAISRTDAKEGGDFPSEERLAPRAAAMPLDDDGAAQRAVNVAASGTSKGSALRAALKGVGVAASEAGLGRRPIGSFFRDDSGAFEKKSGFGEDTVSWEDGFETDADAGKWDEDSISNEMTRDLYGNDRNDVGARDSGFLARRSSKRRGKKTNAAAYSSVRSREDEHDTIRSSAYDDFADYIEDDSDIDTSASLPTIEPTEFEHGATHQAALDELEASIKHQVVEEHERRRRRAGKGRRST